MTVQSGSRARQFHLGLLSPSGVVIGGYLVSIAVAEWVVVSGGILGGAAAHALVIVAVSIHLLWVGRAPYRRLLLALLVLPLTRLLGMTMPVADLPVLTWFVLPGIAMLAGVVLAARALRIAFPLISGASPRRLAVQVGIGSTGIVHGLVAYLLLRPAPLGADLDPVTGVAGAIALAGFVALPEELLFRGLIQFLAFETFGRGSAMVISSAAFAVLYISSMSLVFLLFIIALGTFLAWCVEETNSLLGVITAHSLLVIGLVIVWPMVLS